MSHRIDECIAIDTTAVSDSTHLLSGQLSAIDEDSWLFVVWHHSRALDETTDDVNEFKVALEIMEMVQMMALFQHG